MTSLDRLRAPLVQLSSAHEGREQALMFGSADSLFTVECRTTGQLLVGPEGERGLRLGQITERRNLGG